MAQVAILRTIWTQSSEVFRISTEGSLHRGTSLPISRPCNGNSWVPWMSNSTNTYYKTHSPDTINSTNNFYWT